jgi:hypothetical protein
VPIVGVVADANVLLSAITGVHPFEVYRSHFAWAVRALARRLRLPLWSNDRDLQGLSIPCHTTARLLAMLAHQRESE